IACDSATVAALGLACVPWMKRAVQSAPYFEVSWWICWLLSMAGQCPLRQPDRLSCQSGLTSEAGHRVVVAGGGQRRDHALTPFCSRASCRTSATSITPAAAAALPTRSNCRSVISVLPVVVAIAFQDLNRPRWRRSPTPFTTEG